MRDSIIIALEDLDFVWKDKEVSLFIEYWEQGMSIQCISKELKRTQEECVCLIMHLALEEELTQRKGGLFGTY